MLVTRVDMNKVDTRMPASLSSQHSFFASGIAKHTDCFEPFGTR